MIRMNISNTLVFLDRTDIGEVVGDDWMVETSFCVQFKFVYELFIQSAFRIRRLDAN